MKNNSNTTVYSFLSNISKLDKNVHVRAVSPVFGTVTLRKSAAENNGKRLYSVSSSVIHSGPYTAAGLRKALLAFVA